MVFKKEEYRIIDDGIWIPRKVLDECQHHYQDVADGKHLREPNNLQKAFYTGKVDVYRDLLKHFENSEPQEK